MNDANKEIARRYDIGEPVQKIAFNMGLSVVDVNTAISRMNLKPTRVIAKVFEPSKRRAIEEHQELIHEREMQAL